jgi:hypothetical protein
MLDSNRRITLKGDLMIWACGLTALGSASAVIIKELS